MEKITHNDLERMRRILFLRLLQDDCEQHASDGSNGGNNTQYSTHNSSAEDSGKTAVFEVPSTLIGYLYAKFVLLKILLRHKKRKYLIAVRGI